eukprot:RCo021541
MSIHLPTNCCSLLGVRGIAHCTHLLASVRAASHTSTPPPIVPSPFPAGCYLSSTPNLCVPCSHSSSIPHLFPSPSSLSLPLSLSSAFPRRPFTAVDPLTMK